MKKILRARYVGYTTETENHGDEALMWIIAQLFAPEIEVVFEGDRYDLALLGGGTLINQSPWLIDHFGAILKKAPLGGIVFGSGVGDRAFWGDYLSQWKGLLSDCDLAGVRGPQSLQLLQEAGVFHAEIIGDPYLALQSPLLSAPQSDLLGFNCGTTNNALWGGNEQEYLDFLFALLDKYRALGWKFLFLSVWSKDLPILRSLRDRLGGSEIPILDARAQSLETLARLSSCQVFVGEKLHACAMAAVAEVPFIALEYQPKVRDFSESLQMDSYTVSTAERRPEQLMVLIDKVAKNREVIRVRLQHSLASNRQKIDLFNRRVKQHFHAKASGSEGDK
jgi:polysaccharide pyruvyl transferase WcaK-like protein